MKTNDQHIEAIRAGRESVSTWPDLWQGVPLGALLDARYNAATAGEEFAASRELRRRERERRARR